MKSILKETQLERDRELSRYSGVPVAQLQRLAIASPQAIRVHTEQDIRGDDFSHVYKAYPHLQDVDYLRTLSALTVTRRAKYITQLARVLDFRGKRVLDFGSGVGTHGIACAQAGAYVTMLDVDGPLRRYAEWRVGQRHLDPAPVFINHDTPLAADTFDAVLCLDVLEHVAKPVATLASITAALKVGGWLSLEVGLRVKPTSGHFSQSVNAWKHRGPQYLRAHYCQYTAHLWRRV